MIGFEAIAAGFISSALVEILKQFSVDIPEEYEKNNLEAFKAYIIEKNQNELVLKLDELLSLAQRNEIDSTGHGLKLDVLIDGQEKIVSTLKKGFSEIAECLRQETENQNPDVELGIKLCNSKFIDSEKPFYSAIFQIAPFVRNLKGQRIESALFEITMPTKLRFRVVNQPNVKPVVSYAERSLQYDISSLYGGKTYSPVSFIFKIEKGNIQSMLKDKVEISFRWKNDFVTKGYALKDFFKHDNEELSESDFRKPETRKKKRQPNPYTETFWD
jgi:hypothetical protein